MKQLRIVCMGIGTLSFYASSIVQFVNGNRSTGVMYLLVGSAFLCMFVLNIKNNK